MKATFFGVRGTCPVTADTFRRFGGHTTALLVEGRDGERICLDAGSGMIDISRRLRNEPEPAELLILMTHYHLDHLVGLGSLSQLYNGDWRLWFAAPICDGVTAREGITRILGRPYWPVQLASMEARIDFIDLPLLDGVRHQHGGLVVRWCPVRHNVGCTAYRIDEEETGDSLVFATDLEWGRSTDDDKAAFLDLCREPEPAAVLIFDGNYTQEDYQDHIGWGHSTVDDAVAVARQTGVTRLLVTHHGPGRSDDALDRIEQGLSGEMPGASLARQGMVVEF